MLHHDEQAVLTAVELALSEGVTELEVRCIAYHMKSALFPPYKEQSGFDFAASEINEATVRTLRFAAASRLDPSLRALHGT